MEIPDLAIDRFFPVIMLAGIIAAGFISGLTGDEPEIIIAVFGFIAVIYSIKRNFQKIGLEMIWNGKKFPEWMILLVAATKGAMMIFPVSLLLTLLFRTPVIFELIIVGPLVALLENRKTFFVFPVLSKEVAFQFALIIQLFAIVAVTRDMVIIAILAAPVSFLLSFLIYRIDKKIEEQINAREDE